MKLIIFFSMFLIKTIFCQQGIFDPTTFTQNSCTGNYQWSGWFDTNDPNLNQGDFEVTKHIQQLFAGFMCAVPIAIEARTSSDGNPTQTGDVFRISINDGFFCLNQQIAAFKNKLCADYKVRYCCPS